MDTQAQIKEIVTSHPVVLFMKGTAQFPQCGFSGNAINLLRASGVEELHTVNVLEDEGIRQGIKQFSNWVRERYSEEMIFKGVEYIDFLEDLLL